MKKVVSAEERIKIYELCKKQLSGKWADINQDDLIIDAMIDGNINKLFICRLPENIQTKYNKIVLRYTTQEFTEFKSEVNVLAVNVILSENQLSPKLLSVFNEGVIIEFIEGRHFNNTDDLNNKTVELLAGILAKFHSMKIPIPKACNQMFFRIGENEFFAQIERAYNTESFRQKLVEKSYKTLLSLNFVDEIKWVRGIILALNNCPVVFSHNDFNRKNILVKESNDSSEVKIFLIDFDWTSYNYRGVDLGQYFCSWGQIEIDFGSGDFPTDDQMSIFIDAYIKAMSKIVGNSYIEKEVNSRERLIKESKIFALMAFMKDIMYCIWQTELMANDLLGKAETRFECYKILKEKIMEQYSI